MQSASDREGQETWYPIRVAALRLAAEARAVDRLALGRLEPREQLARLRPIVERLLTLALELLDHVVSTCGLTSGNRAASTLSFEHALDAAVRDTYDPGDLAQLVRVEFRRRRARAADTDSTRTPTMLALADHDRHLDGVSKALSALDLAVARASGTSAMGAFSFELERALVVRRAYARLAQEVLVEPAAEPAPERLSPQHRLASAARAIQHLIEHGPYAALRIGDRLLLSDALSRIHRWSSSAENDPASLDSAALIHSQLTLLIAVLHRVNQRRELIAHDATLIRQALDQSKLRHGRALSPAFVDRFQGLRGLSRELDSLLDSPHLARAEAWTPLLTTLAQAYAGPSITRVEAEASPSTPTGYTAGAKSG